MLGCEKAEAVAVEGGEVAVDGFVAFLACHECGEEGHDVRVGVHGGEGCTVALLPGAECEACGFELESGGHGSQFVRLLIALRR